MRAETISPPLASLLWLAMERGASLIVAADPPSAGKTTILSALLAFTPPDTLAYFTRGTGETFDLPPLNQAYHTYVLVNEMSDHLPVYTWGSHARRAFELLAQGYSLGTTMHANSLEEVVDQLNGELGIPFHHIGHLTLVIPLHIGYSSSVERRVKEVKFLRPQGGNSFSHREIARWDQTTDSFNLFDSSDALKEFAAWADLDARAIDGEIGKREGFLRQLLDNGITSIPAVTQAIEAFYQGETSSRPEG